MEGTGKCRMRKIYESDHAVLRLARLWIEQAKMALREGQAQELERVVTVLGEETKT